MTTVKFNIVGIQTILYQLSYLHWRSQSNPIDTYHAGTALAPLMLMCYSLSNILGTCDDHGCYNNKSAYGFLSVPTVILICTMLGWSKRGFHKSCAFGGSQGGRCRGC